LGGATPLAASAVPLAEGKEVGDGSEEDERRRESRRSPLKWGPTAESITSSVFPPAAAAVAGALSWRSLRGSEVLTRGGGGVWVGEGSGGGCVETVYVDRLGPAGPPFHVALEGRVQGRGPVGRESGAAEFSLEFFLEHFAVE